jgi:hypothetical protein
LTPGLTLTTSRDSSKTFEGKILEIGNDGFAIYGVSENESKTFVSSMEFNIDNYDLALVKNRNNKNSVDFAFGIEKSVLNTEKLYFSETYIIEKVSEGINEIIF